GVKTGANDVFLRELARADELPADYRAPAVLGRDIAPFTMTASSVILAALDARGGALPDVSDAVRAYLRPHHAALARRADARGVPPWSLFRTELLQGPWMVLWRDIADRLEAV